jgi:tRNA modification GTPase
VLTDTAGLRESADAVEAIGVERTGRLVNASDILVWLGDPAEAPGHPRLIQVYPKSDLHGEGPPGSISVSAKTGEGLKPLLERIGEEAKFLLPGEDSIALNRRQATQLAEAFDALDRASAATDVVLIAENLRQARAAFDRLTGRAGVEDVLDALFGRFCLGK